MNETEWQRNGLADGDYWAHVSDSVAYWFERFAGVIALQGLSKSQRIRLINCLARNAPLERSLGSLTERKMSRWRSCGKKTIALILALKAELSSSTLPLHVEGAGGI